MSAKVLPSTEVFLNNSSATKMLLQQNLNVFIVAKTATLQIYLKPLGFIMIKIVIQEIFHEETLNDTKLNLLTVPTYCPATFQ